MNNLEETIHRYSPNPQAEVFSAICNARELSEADRKWARDMRTAYRRYHCLRPKQIAVVEGLCRKLGLPIDGSALFGHG